MKTRSIIILALLGIVCLVVYKQISLFVVQPIGAVPEGRTLIITRLNVSKFIDSADAMCERIQGSVNLLCRGMVMGAVAEKAYIIARLPYSSILYEISTNGKTYDR